MSPFTLARPYAKAVFALAQEENALAPWSEMLIFAGAVAQNKQMIEAMKDPKFSSDDIVQWFIDLGKEFYTPRMRNFITTLGKAKRLKLLPEIALLYEQMRAQAERVLKVELISALPVGESFQKRFREALKRRTGCDIHFESVTDKSLLGGAIIRAGDLVIDGSIRGKLAKLGTAMGIS